MTESVSLMSLTDKKQAEAEPNGKVRRWHLEIATAEKEFRDWCTRGKRIVRRFKDERAGMEDSIRAARVTRYNILWSNVNTLLPSLFSRIPKPEIERKFRDPDPLGRVASTILERATDSSLKSYDFTDTIRNCVLDFLLPGRGQVWIKYVPYFGTEIDKMPVNLDEPTGQFFDPSGNIIAPERIQQEPNGKMFFTPEDPKETIIYEEVKCEYVFWEDFFHNPARIWDEVTWVARRVYMSKDEIRKRFGNQIAEDIVLDSMTKGSGDDADELGPENEAFKKATVYEIWDKDDKKVYWLAKSLKDKFLDEEDDPLGLTDFFPCPRPLYATTTTDSLVPISDFSLYQDQAKELDELSTRISLLVESLRVVGVYDASFPALKDVVKNSPENTMVPVADWPTFQQRGGFEGVMQFVPLGEVAQVLQQMYESRAQILQDIYQITGISDIIRGATSPSETATAQQLKGQFATLRLADRQREVQRFIRDIISIKAEIIAEHFDKNTIRLVSGSEFIHDPQSAQMFEDAIELLRNDVLRNFRVSIETDSTLAIDESLEKEKRTEFLGTIGRFLDNSLQTMQAFPEVAPLMSESLLFLMRGFKASRGLESATEQAMQAMMARIKQQQEQPPPPSPEEIKMQIMQQVEQQKMQMTQQVEQAKLQLEQFKTQMKVQVDQQKAFADAEIAQLRLHIESQSAQGKQALELQKAQADINLQREKFGLETQLRVAELEANMQIKQKEIIEKQNVETIKALTSIKEEKGEGSSKSSSSESNGLTDLIKAGAITTNIAMSKKSPKVIKFSTTPDGDRVAEVVAYEE